MKPEVDLDPELIEGLEKIAKRLHTSLENIYNQMAELYIEKQLRRNNESGTSATTQTENSLVDPPQKGEEKNKKRLLSEKSPKIIMFPGSTN